MNRLLARPRSAIGIALLLMVTLSSAAEPGGSPTCRAFELRGLKPGLQFRQVRKQLGSKWDSIRHERNPTASATSLIYLTRPTSTIVLFDRNPTVDEDARLLSIQVCSVDPRTPESNPIDGWESRWGRPISGFESLANELRDAPAVWSRRDCGIRLSAFRRPAEWWERAPDALCVELGSFVEAPVAVAAVPPAPSPAPAPVSVPTASEDAPPIVDETAEEPMIPPRPQATAARLTRSVAPVYPESAPRDGRTVKVVVELTVTTEGIPSDLRVLSTTQPDEGFERAALDAIAQFRYEPATLGEKTVSQRVRVSVVFR